MRVRMYRVGFGDFFLLSVPAGAEQKHILIDCGVTPGTTHAGDLGTIKAAVADMAKVTGGKLALIIATHRHMDHIVGFSRCEAVFKSMSVEAIWMSYWESEYDAQAQKFQSQLTAVALGAQQRLALAAVKNIDVDAMLGMLQNATGIDHRDGLQAMAAAAAGASAGTGGGSNKASLDLLKNGLGVKPNYYARGDTPVLPQSLVDAGVTAEILGPPPAEALGFLQLTDLTKTVGQYLGEDENQEPARFDPFGTAWHATRCDYPATAFGEFSRTLAEELPDAGAALLEEKLKTAQPSLLMTEVKKLDACLNNQSLVVLFTIAGKKLLFAGDAQGGSWEYWMYGGTPNKAPSVDKLTAEGKSILGQLDFYKVGHHGSTNATPITAVQAMGGTFVSMCSTQEKTYGNGDKGTEVPRTPLMQALGAKSDLVRSDFIDVTGVAKIATAPPLVQPKKGQFVPHALGLDYLF